jgi:peptidyl-prolyl cis-trans isomerase D
MAIIGKIRERSTLVLIIIGGAIVAFVLSDLFSSSQGGRQQGPINLAEVNGTSVNPQEFELKVQKAYENYQVQTEEELDERTKSTIREQVWTEILSDILLGKQMDELGIEVTSKELFDMVQGNNPHPQVKQAFTNPETGEFNSSAVVGFLQNLDNDPKVKAQWIEFERALKRNQAIDKYYKLVKKGLYVPTKLAEKEFKSNKTAVNFKYVYRSYASMPDSLVQLSESEIEVFYENCRDISIKYLKYNKTLQ